ncbi:hypothetical protein LAZ67_23002072 [Cordylochernes scorpioides]|uniref:Uncharacterized protein n=1 Tax=Cordylochernes scorpioides TaxID=51811 RepID=A0ABY6LTM5_9ARAC|nr:hypothetical protein LAZ67_23002072 [Cordylochernes scorpioides]
MGFEEALTTMAPTSFGRFDERLSASANSRLLTVAVVKSESGKLHIVETTVSQSSGTRILSPVWRWEPAETGRRRFSFGFGCVGADDLRFWNHSQRQLLPADKRMGSPLSTTLAEIVPATIDSWITEIKPNEVLIWLRYSTKEAYHSLTYQFHNQSLQKVYLTNTVPTFLVQFSHLPQNNSHTYLNKKSLHPLFIKNGIP